MWTYVGIAVFSFLALGAIWLNFFSPYRIKESIGFMCTGCNWTGSKPILEFTRWLTVRKKSCPKCGAKVIPF